MKNSKSLKLTVSETQTRNEKAPQASYVALQGPEKYAQLLGDKKEALIRSQCWMHSTWKVNRRHHNTATFQWPVNPWIKDLVKTVSCQQDCTAVLTNTWIYRCSRAWCFAFIHLVTAPNNSTFFTWMFSHKHIRYWNSQSFKLFKTYESHNILEYLCWHLHWRCKAMLSKKTL